MKFWNVWCLVIWPILRFIQFPAINANQCLSSFKESHLKGFKTTNGFANLFRKDPEMAGSRFEKYCVTYTAVHSGNVWTIVINCAESFRDEIGALLDDFDQHSAFGLRDSDALFIEACNETSRFGFEATSDTTVTCPNQQNITADCWFEMTIQVAFKMAALRDNLMSSWYDDSRIGVKGAIFLVKTPRKQPKKKNRAVQRFRAGWQMCALGVALTYLSSFVY